MRERSIDIDMVFDAILTSKQGNLGAVTKLYINILKFRSYWQFSAFPLTPSHLEHLALRDIEGK